MTLRTYNINTVRKHGTLLYRNTYKADSCSDNIAFVEDTSDTTTATELGIEVWSLIHDNVKYIVIIKYANNRDNVYEHQWCKLASDSVSTLLHIIPSDFQ